ncbi:MAG: PPC domain-containing protein [Myxococcota bacterium]|nr:PPC domain-containing protein [Myxococcota bacterium]
MLGRRLLHISVFAAVLFGSGLMAGCPVLPGDGQPAPGPPPGPDLPPEPDLVEVEPNDEVPQALGIIELPLLLGGSMAGCGSDGSFDGTDVDRFSFEVGAPVVLDIRLEAWGGDLDLRAYDPDGNLLSELDHSGIQPEELLLSIGPERTYSLEIVCWQGNAPEWRVALGSG